MAHLLTIAEASAFLRIPKGTLAYWRCVGTGPAYVKLGRNILYPEAELLSFVQSNTVRPSTQVSASEEAKRVAL